MRDSRSGSKSDMLRPSLVDSWSRKRLRLKSQAASLDLRAAGASTREAEEWEETSRRALTRVKAEVYSIEAEELPADDGLIDLIQAIIFHMSSLDLTMVP